MQNSHVLISVQENYRLYIQVGVLVNTTSMILSFAAKTQMNHGTDRHADALDIFFLRVAATRFGI